MTSWNQIVSSIERNDADPPRARLIVNTDIPFTDGEATQQLAAAIEKLNGTTCSACGRPGHGADDPTCPRKANPRPNGTRIDPAILHEHMRNAILNLSVDQLDGRTTAHKITQAKYHLLNELNKLDLGKAPTTPPTGKELETLETHGVVVPADHLPTILTHLFALHINNQDRLTVLPHSATEYIVHVQGARDDINALLNTLDALSL